MSQTTTADPPASTGTPPASTGTPPASTGAPPPSTGTPPATTLLTDTGKDGTSQPAGSAWREDWREALATVNGEPDPKLLNQFKRYTSPEALAAAHVSLRQRMDSGDFIQKLPADAKPEEVTAWRAANGIPEAPEGYLEKLPAGLSIGEADKPMVTEFLSELHKVNASPDVANAALKSYYAMEERIAAERTQEDTQFLQEQQDALRLEWGAEFRGNVNAVTNLLNAMGPKGVMEKLSNARMDGGAGRPLFADADVFRFLATVSKEINPAATVMPAAGASAGQDMNAEIQEIEKMMGNRSSDYWRGPKADTIQARYRTLVEARDKMASRAAA